MHDLDVALVLEAVERRVQTVEAEAAPRADDVTPNFDADRVHPVKNSASACALLRCECELEKPEFSWQAAGNRHNWHTHGHADQGRGPGSRVRNIFTCTESWF